MNTVEVSANLWCRWSSEASALELAAGCAGPVELAGNAPEWRRREHHAGRRLLAALLLDVAPATPRGPIEVGPNGKPVLRDAPEVGISISHSYPLVAAAVGLGWDVGVDAQVEPFPHHDHDSCLPGSGCSAARSRGAGQSDRLWAWTVREACVKATGAGLSARPWRIPVADGDAGVWREVSWRSLRSAAPLALSVAWRPRGRRPAPTARADGALLP